MATIVQFPRPSAAAPRSAHNVGQGSVGQGNESAEIINFPGARIDRCEFDLTVRMKDTVGNGDFDTIAFGGPAVDFSCG